MGLFNRIFKRNKVISYKDYSYCPNCGAKLEKQSEKCPECHYNFIKHETASRQDMKSEDNAGNSIPAKPEGKTEKNRKTEGNYNKENTDLQKYLTQNSKKRETKETYNHDTSKKQDNTGISVGGNIVTRYSIPSVGVAGTESDVSSIGERDDSGCNDNTGISVGGNIVTRYSIPSVGVAGTESDVSSIGERDDSGDNDTGIHSEGVAGTENAAPYMEKKGITVNGNMITKYSIPSAGIGDTVSAHDKTGKSITSYSLLDKQLYAVRMEREGEKDIAYLIFLELMQEGANTPAPYNKAADYNLKKGNYKEAIEIYERAEQNTKYSYRKKIRQILRKHRILDNENTTQYKLRYLSDYELYTYITRTYKKLEKHPEENLSEINELIPLIDKNLHFSGNSDKKTAKLYRIKGEIALLNNNREDAMEHFRKALDKDEKVGVKTKYNKLLKELNFKQ